MLTTLLATFMLSQPPKFIGNHEIIVRPGITWESDLFYTDDDNVWATAHETDFEFCDEVVLTMDNNGTAENSYDDIIISIRKRGIER